MKTAIASFAFICIASACLALPGEPRPKLDLPPAKQEIVGWYHADGKDGDGNPTSGVCVIDRMESGNYRLHWLYVDSGRSDAVGARDGNALLVGYGKPIPVVMRYQIEAGKDGPLLRGKWASWQHNGEETLTWMKGLGKN